MNPASPYPAPYPALEAAARGATVVTANKRLAGVLRNRYLRQRQEAGESVWETPDILPWAAWMQREWEALLVASLFGDTPECGLLLSPLQEHCVWLEVIAASESGDSLLQPDATARLAAEARRLLRGWGIASAELESAPGRDARAFIGWQRAFERRCEERGWIDRARLPALLASAFREFRLSAPAGLYLSGFDELAPAEQALLDAIAASGTRIEFDPVQATVGRVHRRACADREAEIVAAAWWARRELEALGGGAGTGLGIGIVVPDLADCRSLVQRVMEDILTPGAVLPGEAATPRHDVSLGRALSAWPVIHDALVALDAHACDPSLSAAGLLLRSPFIAGAETERTARGLFDARLREQPEPRVSLGSLAAAAAKNGCPALAAALRRSGAAARALPLRQRPSQWAEDLLRLLQVLGWPGERVLDSDEYQAVEAWRDVVSDLASLDAVRAAVTLNDVLSQLRRMSDERLFQPEGPAAPIQVLGVLEAAGLRFDRLWVTGLHDGLWPPPPDPNPFIPLHLQRARGLPRATPERELAVANRLFARLCAASPEVCFSHPLAAGDQVLRISALIEDLPEDGERLGRGPLYREVIRDSGQIETFADDRAPPLPPGDAPGGARLFQLQAACPFRAFAELRLNARPLGEPVPGADARERGNLMHRALERIWQRLRTSEALAALDSGSRDAMLAEVVGAVLGEAAAERPLLYTPKFVDIEGWRMMRRLREWLDVESRRAPFVVEATEEKHRVDVGGLAIDVRIDRIDRLESGRRAVIDYKTGDVSVDAWFGERPDEPQLPLYGLALGDGLEAILFARLKTGKVGYVGVAGNDAVVPGEKAVKVFDATRYVEVAGSWDGQRYEWARILERLATDFREGVAAVDPKRYPGTCGYCGLAAFCRIDEPAFLEGEEVPS